MTSMTGRSWSEMSFETVLVVVVWLWLSTGVISLLDDSRWPDTSWVGRVVVVAVSLNGCHWSEMSCNGCVGSGFVNCGFVLVVLKFDWDQSDIWRRRLLATVTVTGFQRRKSSTERRVLVR